MPFYKSLNPTRDSDRRTILGLQTLKPSLDDAIPHKTTDSTLLIATWNIREFGGTKYGGRETEPLFYIAEIISRFDLVAIQEVRDDLDSLEKLMGILGSWWKFLVTDVTLGRQGNNERLAFIYDSRKVSFSGLVGELQPEMIKTGETLASDFAFARSPFLAGFRAGWFKFTMVTDHFYYGESKPDDPQRLKESQTIIELLKKRIQSKDRWASNAILLGDFNIFSLNDKTFSVIEDNKFKIPKNLRGIYSNAKKDKPFDQIAFYAPEIENQLTANRAGIFDFFSHVYRDNQASEYNLDDKKFKDYRTYKMSDHLPLWVEVKIDFAAEYLTKKLNETPPVPSA